jgi:hypothetical protein
MVRRRYEASGKTDDGAPMRLALLALVVGAVAGAVEGFVSGWFDLLIIFPLVIGLAAGGAAAKAVKDGKVRAPVLAAWLAALGGLAGQGVKQEVQYQRFLRSPALAQFQGDGPGIDDVLRITTGKTGRAGYLLLRARQGTTISRHGPSGPTLRGPAFWVLFGVEFLLAGATAFGIGWSAASDPFCERCKKWYGPDTPVAGGAGDKQSVTASISALEASDWRRFAEGLGAPDTKAATQVLIAACPGCTDNDRRLTLRLIHRPGHRKQKATARFVSMIRPDELRGLEGALAERKGTPSGASGG